MKKITFFIALMTVFYARAQWTSDYDVNTLVADSNSEDSKSIGTSDGQTYIVFWKAVPAPENFELRLQILDASGMQQLGPDGALISDEIPMSTFTSLWTIRIDDNDNLYVGVTGTSNDTGLAYKIDTTGTVLWTVTNPDALLVNVLPLSSGDAIVSWLSTSSDRASMQKYDETGSAIWPSVQTAEIGNSDTAPADLYDIGSGDFVMVIHELGNGVNSTLYAQRFDEDGDAVWTTPTRLSNKTTAFNTTYSGTQDDDVIYYGYIGKTATRFDAYLQRIDPDGDLPWGINGADFDASQTDFEMKTDIAYESGSDFIWAVCIYTNQGQSLSGEYVQKFDKDSGERQFSETAKEVFAIGSFDVHQGKLQLVNDEPLFLIKSGQDNGATPTTLSLCLLDEDGNFVWAEETMPVASFQANKNRIELNRPFNGQVTCTFIEDKGEGMKIYSQNFEDDAILSTTEFSAAPSINYLNPIQENLVISSNVTIQEITIYNTSGQIISNLEVNGSQINLNAQSWTSGLYFAVLNINGQPAKTIKIIKE